jgi:malic enzyme
MSLVDEFMSACHNRWPEAVIQFEDFSSDKAMTILNEYKDEYCCFNDDIQGTGATTLAGILSALRVQGKTAKDLVDQRIVVAGAGSAGLGLPLAVRSPPSLI